MCYVTYSCSTMNQGGAVTTTNTNTVAQQELADHFDLDLDLAERIVADINGAIDDLVRGEEMRGQKRRAAVRASSRAFDQSDGGVLRPHKEVP